MSLSPESYGQSLAKVTMPEKPPQKRRHLRSSKRGLRNSVPLYAELHCKSNFSFLEGASHADELVQRSTELGYAALAITDRNSLAGVVRAHVAAKEAGLHLLVGAEITPEDSRPVVLLATDRAAYGRLARLITNGRRRASKGQCRIFFRDIAEHADGLLAAVVTAERPSTRTDPLSRCLADYREIFGDRCYAFLERCYGPDDEKYLFRTAQVADSASVPTVAANDVRYHQPGRKALEDVLVAIRVGRPVSEVREHLFPNRERYLKSPAQMAELFAGMPEAVQRSVELAQRCTFCLDELRYEYPEELCPDGLSPIEYLSQLAWRGARKRYPAGIPEKVRDLLEHELRLIEELHYAAYFLTVWDLVCFARRRNILCQGRGSAANSVVCYCLEVTSVDPERIDVLFERFVSRERNEAPDIDVDFEHERREEVLQYLYDKYGRERAGITAEVITYRTRSALRDVGKALGLSSDRLDALAKSVDGRGEDAGLVKRLTEANVDPDSRLGRQLVWLVEQLVGFPRHLSQHVGGMVMTQGPLCEMVPIENAAMPERTVIQWDKDDLDALGILKVDCLALGMLTAIHKSFDLIDRRLTLANVPPEDPAVYAMIQKADTMGVFQIESRAQMSMLPRLKPRCFYDLVIEVAIVRPGPIQGDMVHPYLRRREGEEPVAFPNESIRQVLCKTLGVPLFQEQAMRLAVVAAGFTPGEADQLRRAMGAWRRPGLIEQFHQKLIQGMTATGLSADYAERVFLQIRGFGEYGFPESHAASFALLVYVSAWLKCYHPAAFTAALLNSQPMGFYAPAQLVRNARQHGVEVLPVDVQASQWDCTLEDAGTSTEGAKSTGPALRLGLRMIGGLSPGHAETIAAARADGPFRSLDDFARRTGLGQAVIVRLTKADAFGSLGLDRRQALWDALPPPASDQPLLADLEPEEPEAALPALTAAEEVLADYRSAGLSLRAHPIAFVRHELDQAGVTRAAELPAIPNGRFLRVAGLVLVRQRPGTARGITFVTLEDETAHANLIVRPEVWERYRRSAYTATAWIAHGRLQKQGPILHLLTSRIEDLSARLAGLRQMSRDFC